MAGRNERRVAAKTPKAQRPKAHKTDEPDGIVRNKQDVMIGLNHGGMFYPMEGLNDEDFAEMEKSLLAERWSPAETLKEEFAKLKDVPALQEMLVDRAYQDMRKKQPSRDRISAEEMREYLNTRDGSVHSLWMMMRKHDPEITRERVAEIFNDCAEADMHRRIDEANRDLIVRAGVSPRGEKERLESAAREADAPPQPDPGDPKQTAEPVDRVSGV